VATILEAAARVFGARGYLGATTNRIAIAEGAGVSIGSLYEYFPNKAALLAALVEEHLSASRSLLDGMVETARAEGAPGAPLHPRVRAATLTLEDATVQAVAALLRRHPEVRVKDPALAVVAVVRVVESLIHTLVIRPRARRDPARAVAEITALATGYLAGGSYGRATARVGEGTRARPA
jgi:AcrR family transcriptional regulator